ncbi:hypothetical protein CHS0354_005397 [Potamilus streckersoni]|uniref:Tripartite motif-containing protein 2 n=1 Tax=Potamilus streckersoni TaxID=2493646 RepID=A0AAE0SKF3_9BIVA|nr:hypothetical protein CHS0354_005397 [Potamilus streckersoni]
MIKQFIARLESAALEDLDQMCKQETVTISDEMTECKSAIAAIETSERMLMDGTVPDDDTKLFITMTKVSQQVLKYRDKYKGCEIKSEVVELEFHRDCKCDEINKSLNSLGKTFRRASKITSSTTENMQKEIIPNSMVIFSAKISSDNKVCSIYSGVFLPDDRLVLSDVRNKKLKMFDKSFQCISSLMFKRPRFVCRLDDSTVAITSRNKINIVSVVNTLTLLRSIYIGVSCNGIAYYQQKIVVNISGKSLLTYNTSGKIISKVQSYDDCLGGMYNTHCVSQDGQNIYCTKANVIVTMDMNGNKLNTFESKDLKGAKGITVDKNGMIYSCGSDSNTVIEVTPQGRQLDVLLSSDDGLSNPIGLCLNDRKDVILVFERISNDLLSHFGSPSRREGDEEEMSLSGMKQLEDLEQIQAFYADALSNIRFLSM